MYANLERSQFIFLHLQNPVPTALWYCWSCCWTHNSELADIRNEQKLGWWLKIVWIPRFYSLQPQPLCCSRSAEFFNLQYRQLTPDDLHTSKLGPSGMCCLSPLLVCMAFVPRLGVGHCQQKWEALSPVSKKTQGYTQTKELTGHGAFL